jgi:hypothetical protein
MIPLSCDIGFTVTGPVVLSEFCLQLGAAHVLIEDLLSDLSPPDKTHAASHGALH